MGRSRLDLHGILVGLMPVGAEDDVYFQPETNIQLTYPCIVYERDNARTQFADDQPYRFTQRYSVKYISRDPDDGIRDTIALLPMCLFSRHFVTENLHHDVFTLYF